LFGFSERFDFARFAAVTAFVAALLACGAVRGEADSWRGVTIVKLTDKSAADAVGAIFSSMFSDRLHLVVFMSDDGSYASIATPPNGGQHCIAWSEDDPDQESVTFGVRPDRYNGRPAPGWCHPFTLTFEDAGSVRMVADNTVAASANPHDARTRQKSHDGVHPIVAHAALKDTDYSRPIFAANAVRGITAGPVPKAKTGGTNVTIGPRRELSFAVHKMFSARLEPDHAGGRPLDLRGQIAAAEETGWGEDRLVSIGLVVRRADLPDYKAARDGLIDARGVPSIQFDGSSFIWLYDSDGRLLQPEPASADDCRVNFDLWGWDRNVASSWESLAAYDVGPWGCALVSYVGFKVDPLGVPAAPRMDALGTNSLGTDDRPRLEGAVTEITYKHVAGDALGQAHFAMRLDQVAAARTRHLIIAPPAEEAAPSASTPPAPDVSRAIPASTAAVGPRIEHYLSEAGVVFDMDEESFRSHMAATGFEDISGLWKREFDRSVLIVSANYHMQRMLSLTAEELTLDPGRSPDAVTSAFATTFGAEGECLDTRGRIDFAECVWRAPNGLPGVGEMIVRVKSGRRVSALKAEGTGNEIRVVLRARP